MHQNIENFSQIMDIDTSGRLIINYEFKVHRNLCFEFYINERLYKKNTDEISIDLKQKLNFCIKNIHGDGALEIKKLTLNGFEIMPKYLSRSTPPTNWIENINFWNYEISMPVFAYIQELTGNGDIF